MALSALMDQQISTGTRYLQEAILKATSMDFVQYGGIAIKFMADGLLLLRKYKDAIELAEEGMRLTDLRNLFAEKASLTRIIAEASLHLDPVDPLFVETKLKEAMTLATKNQFKFEMARCHQVQSKLYIIQGKPDSAQLELEKAKAIFEQVGILKWYQAMI